MDDIKWTPASDSENQQLQCVSSFLERFIRIGSVLCVVLLGVLSIISVCSKHYVLCAFLLVIGIIFIVLQRRIMSLWQTVQQYMRTDAVLVSSRTEQRIHYGKDFIDRYVTVRFANSDELELIDRYAVGETAQVGDTVCVYRPAGESTFDEWVARKSSAAPTKSSINIKGEQQ